MKPQFYLDLAIGKRAEQIALEALIENCPQYSFKDVSNNREYFYKGDIIATNAKGESKYIEVKNDSRIAETQNILCEYLVYYNDKGYKDGNMKNNSDIYCVVSESERSIYIIDFSVLKKIYTQGKKTAINHNTQTTYCYLLPLERLKTQKGLINIINY